MPKVLGTAFIYTLKYVSNLGINLWFFIFSVIAIINTDEDIVAYTLKAVDDPRTLNKILYIHPPKNIVSQNEMVALWERKIGKTLEKTYVSEEEVLKSIQGECLSSLLQFTSKQCFHIEF